MGRPPNPARRGELLDEIVDYVLANGLSDLSLRPLAKALGVSTYTLTYQLGPKENMLREVVLHAERRLLDQLGPLPEAASLRDLLQMLWQLESTEAGAQWTRLLLEVALNAERDGRAAGTGLLEGRLDRIASAVEPSKDQDRSLATLLHALVVGLAVDHRLTGDDQRAAEALDLAAQALSGISPDRPAAGASTGSDEG